MDYDITPVLEQWLHRSNEVTVRLITGQDGRQKVQMRLDLGLLQMEMDARPDGRCPHGCESLLEYHKGQLEAYKHRNGVEVGFELSPKHCRALREEAVMYYYRYLSLFILGHYQRVVQDTQRNLEAFDFCRKFAAHKTDRRVLEQYRPYVLMMNARARVQLALDEDRPSDALEICEEGFEKVTDFFKQMSRPELAQQCSELAVLVALREEIKRKLPHDFGALHDDLCKALKEEKYEKAAELRDKLRNLRYGLNEPDSLSNN